MCVILTCVRIYCASYAQIRGRLVKHSFIRRFYAGRGKFPRYACNEAVLGTHVAKLHNVPCIWLAGGVSDAKWSWLLMLVHG